jgi:hypothetical protein
MRRIGWHRTASTRGIGQRLVGGVAVDLEDAVEPGQRSDDVLGAAPVFLPHPEVYTSIAQGIIGIRRQLKVCSAARRSSRP